MKIGRRDIAIVSAIIISGVAIRLFPNILNYAWGNDYGIYYYLSQAFLSGNALAYPPTSPWGTDGYQYFPVTYLIVDGVHNLFGIGIAEALDYSIPILGGLTPFLLYMISRQIGFDRVSSSLAGFLLVVSPIQLYQTSQPNYLTTGHFFLLLSIYFFIAFHKRRIFAIPLAFSIILLVLSHQLSTYFFLISIIGMVFSVNLLSGKWKHLLLHDMLILELTGSFMLIYLLLRVPDMVKFFSGAVHGLGYMGVIVLFYSLMLAMYFLLKRVNSDKIRQFAIDAINKLKMNIDPRRDVALVVVASFAITLVVLMMIVLGVIPGYISYTAVLISLPFIFFLAVSTIGIKYFLIENNIAEVFGWSMAIILSLLYSFASKNTVLLPARHIEYLSEPFSIIAGYVLVKWYIHFKSTKRESKIEESYVTARILTPIPISTPAGVTMVSMPTARVTSNVRRYDYSTRRPVENIFVIAAFSLILLMGVASYPMVSNFVPSHTEAITLEDNATIQYLSEVGNRSLSVATDHQIGILLYSYGFNSPFNNISTLWLAPDWESAIWEITGNNGTFPPIGYVFLNSYMLQYGVWGFNSSNNPNQPPVSVNGSALKKFFLPPFELTYQNKSTDTNSTSYLFTVNWTYLQQRGYNLSHYEGIYNEKVSSEHTSQSSAIPMIDDLEIDIRPPPIPLLMNALPVQRP